MTAAERAATPKSTLDPAPLGHAGDHARPGAGPRRRARPRSGVDIATASGLVLGFGLISLAVVLGGAANSFINLPSLLIVVGGTLAAVAICFSISEVRQALWDGISAIRGRRPQPAAAAMRTLSYADVARRAGPFALQKHLEDMAGEPMLQKGLGLVIDGLAEADLEAILVHDLQARSERGDIGAAVFARAAEFAPAMGLIGTLIGLVQMLGRLEDPSAIGPAMAVALLTTLYGAVLANLVFAPLSAKLERLAAEHTLVDRLYILGALSIARQENPRQLEILLNSMLPPRHRVRYFD